MDPSTLNLAFGIVSGVAVAGIIGNVTMYRQVGELKVEIAHLARAIEALAANTRQDNRAVNERIDDLIGGAR